MEPTCGRCVGRAEGGVSTGTCSVVLEIGGHGQIPFLWGGQRWLEQVGQLMGSEECGQ